MGENDGTSGTGDDGGTSGLVPDAQKNSAGKTVAAVDQGAANTGGGVSSGSLSTTSGEEATEAARNAGVDPVGTLAYSGLDKQGQFRIADKLTIGVEGDHLRLTVAGQGSVKVDEFDLYDAIEKAFFDQIKKRNDAEAAGNAGSGYES